MTMRNRLNGKWYCCCSKELMLVLILTILLGLNAASNAQTLIWIGNPPDSLGNPTWAYDVSWDGRVVVGTHRLDIPPSNEAFYWTSAGGMVRLGFLTCCAGSGAYGVSRDGSVIVGWSVNRDGFSRAFRWTQASGMVDLGTLLGGTESWAYDVSADGTWIVGWSLDAEGQQTAVRWQWRGLWQSPLIENLGGTTAYAVSSDGTVVAGMMLEEGNRRALCWTPQAVYYLGTLGGLESEALGVSPDGRVVVGWAHNRLNQRRAFLWVPGNQSVRDLGTLSGDIESWANDVSDGRLVMDRIVVGASYDGRRQRAVRWSNLGPLPVVEDLNQTYACLLTDGSRLEEATAISPDGRYIVGWGYDASRGFQAGFLLDTQCSPHNGDVNNDGCVDDADLLAVLFAFGQTGECLGRVDVNCDGVVDDEELLTVLFNFGTGC